MRNWRLRGGLKDGKVFDDGFGRVWNIISDIKFEVNDVVGIGFV